ncbi:MAG TPA: hypothetical protein DCR55_00100 [Lentisphaeria bacterium]|mgnify:FL=1|nr:hypothetical protein [Lentisphaeria bacterium]
MKNRLLPTFLVLLACASLFSSCRSLDRLAEEAALPPTTEEISDDVTLRPPNIEADELRHMLHNGRTRAKDVWDVAGQPLNRKPSAGFEVWTYEWRTEEERSAYSGGRIGEERLFMRNHYAFTHTLVRKTKATLVFSKDGILQNFRFDRE